MSHRSRYSEWSDGFRMERTTAMRSFVAVIMAAMMVCLFGMTAPALDLVKDGKPVSTLVLPDEPNDHEKAAAARLVEYFELSSGGKLQIVKEADKPTGTIISVGHTKMAQSAGISEQGIKYDGYRIKVKGDNLYMLGRDTDMILTQNNMKLPIYGGAQGTLMSAFGLLDELGFRWLVPTPKGTYIPKMTTISVADDLDVDYTPPLMYSTGRLK